MQMLTVIGTDIVIFFISFICVLYIIHSFQNHFLQYISLVREKFSQAQI